MNMLGEAETDILDRMSEVCVLACACYTPILLVWGFDRGMSLLIFVLVPLLLY